MERPRPEIRVKICGLTRETDVAAAADAGAAYLGFVFFPPSPRSVDLRRARDLALAAPPGLVKVALTVDAEDAELDAIAGLPIDMLQLHGSESPERADIIGRRTGLPVMKALGLRTAADLAAIGRYAGAADQILVDAKPPEGASRPGGNAVAFDWRLISGRRWPVPWLLAGGLAPGNVAEAVGLTGARQLDVSSGVESAPGVKDPDKIRAFVAAARGATPALDA
ncbi:MAG: phosphoribosylanthranilate isomerase [Paracoccaceae bacterium]